MRAGFALTIAAGVWALLSGGLQADCGMTWRAPKAHFDRLDERGNVMLVEKCGSLELQTESAEFTIPIYALFVSDSTSHSALLGYGWQIPLLESRIHPVGDGEFRVIQPDGRVRTFTRDETNPGILNGQGGWKGEIRGERIELAAECGSRLLYESGHIVEMVTKGVLLRYVYENANLTEIQRDGQALLKVIRATESNAATGLAIADGRKIEFTSTQRPIVGTVGESKVVSRMEAAIGGMATDERTVTFEYGVDEQMSPTIKSSLRVIAWNPVNGAIIHDDYYKYLIQATTGELNAAITRLSPDGSEEFCQTGPGIEVVRTKELETERKWFTTGLLENLPRSFTVKDLATGALKTDIDYTYDENANLLRRTHLDGRVETFVYEGNRLISKTVSKNGQISEEIYDQDGQGKILKMNGRVRDRRHFPVNGAWDAGMRSILAHAGKYMDVTKVTEIKMEEDVKRRPSYQLFSGKLVLGSIDGFGNVNHRGKIEGAEYINGGVRRLFTKSAGDGPVKTEVYDEQGNLESTQITETLDRYTQLTIIKNAQSGSENYVLLRFDEKGRTIEHSSRTGAYKYTFLPDGTREQAFESYLP